MQKEQLLEAILEQQKVVHKDGWNVATSQRRDVGSTNIKFNNMQRRDASTSRRLNVATLQRLNVATLQRRDVSASSAFSSLKAKKRVHILRYRGSYEPGHGNQSSSDDDLEEQPVICIFPGFG